MFYIKKLISSFLLPIPLGLFLFSLGVYYLFRNNYPKAKLVFFITLSWFALFSFQPVSNAIIKPLEDSHKALLQTPKVKYVLVLGNGHISNERLSITSQVNPTAQNRLNEGIRHYKRLSNAKLIVSGYSSYDKNSHAFMQQILASSLGVKTKDILRLDTPKDTQEEAREAKKIIGKQKFILVTSAAHMKRAMMIFQKEGLNPIAAPTNHLAHDNKSLHSYFSSNNIKKVESAFHEYLGIAWMKLKELSFQVLN